MKKALVLLSGGQDSTTCLFWALKNYDQVYAIGFDYGQKHSSELGQAQDIAAMANVDYKIFPVHGILSGSSLTDYFLDVNAQHQNDPSLPSSFTAGRNILFLTIAGAYAYSLGVDAIVTGVCETDYSGYPDCRREFIDSMQKTLELGTGKTFIIETPLMHLTKAETWKLAVELSDNSWGLSSNSGYYIETPVLKKNGQYKRQFNVPLIIRDLTLTDYNGDRTMNEWGMGKDNNPASVLRKKGFLEAKEKGWL